MRGMREVTVPETGAAIDFLLAELRSDRLTSVIDVGANPLFETPYAGLLKRGACRVVGFEPQAEAFAALQKAQGAAEQYFPFAVGDGATHELKVFRASGLTSLFEPYLPTYAAIGLPGWARVKNRVPFDTKALDAIEGLGPCDLLKIDIQGGETLVFAGAEQVLAGAVAVIVELRYLRMYVGEPMLGGVDEELRRQGFYLHKFMFNKSKVLANSQAARLKTRMVRDQLLDGDAVYLRDVTALAAYSDAQLVHQAILAAAVFASHSLVLCCLDELARRGSVPAGLPAAYVDALPAAFRQG